MYKPEQYRQWGQSHRAETAEKNPPAVTTHTNIPRYSSLNCCCLKPIRSILLESCLKPVFRPGSEQVFDKFSDALQTKPQTVYDCIPARSRLATSPRTFFCKKLGGLVAILLQWQVGRLLVPKSLRTGHGPARSVWTCSDRSSKSMTSNSVVFHPYCPS